uniref:Secreted protein n=1 Tax=Steinernema glaseri TaxID=37863 RepID=A0A1I7YU23_9BILA
MSSHSKMKSADVLFFVHNSARGGTEPCLYVRKLRKQKVTHRTPRRVPQTNQQEAYNLLSLYIICHTANHRLHSALCLKQHRRKVPGSDERVHRMFACSPIERSNAGDR